MPNPKTGTVSKDVAKTLKMLNQGKYSIEQIKLELFIVL